MRRSQRRSVRHRSADERDTAESEAPPQPGTVTGMREHPRRPGRVLIAVEGREIGAAPLELIAELGLRDGRLLDAASRGLLDVVVRRTALLDKALDLLAVRARSVRDLSIRLRRTRAAEADIAWVIERLRGQRLLDDEQYARQVARSRVVDGGVSRRGIQDLLYRRGISREQAAAAIEETLAENHLDEHAAALAAARKRLAALRSLDRPTARRRLHAFLARRGYESDVVYRVLRDVLGDREDAAGKETEG